MLSITTRGEQVSSSSVFCLSVNLTQYSYWDRQDTHALEIAVNYRPGLWESAIYKEMLAQIAYNFPHWCNTAMVRTTEHLRFKKNKTTQRPQLNLVIVTKKKEAIRNCRRFSSPDPKFEMRNHSWYENTTPSLWFISVISIESTTKWHQLILFCIITC